MNLKRSLQRKWTIWLDEYLGRHLLEPVGASVTNIACAMRRPVGLTAKCCKHQGYGLRLAPVRCQPSARSEIECCYPYLMSYLGSKSHLLNLEKARAKAWLKAACSHCKDSYTVGNMARHERTCKATPANAKICPVCSGLFYSTGVTCSCKCANTFFRSGTNHGNWKPTSYRTTCFSHHKKQCVVCGEQRIIEVHHFDEDKKNNSPENLVPLCPTHHQYLHSRFKFLVVDRVTEYVTEWKRSK